MEDEIEDSLEDSLEEDNDDNEDDGLSSGFLLIVSVLRTGNAGVMLTSCPSNDCGTAFRRSCAASAFVGGTKPGSTNFTVRRNGRAVNFFTVASIGGESSCILLLIY